MRRLLLAVVSVAALLFAGAASTATTGNVTVEIRKGSFSTRNVTINQDDSVTWKNVDKVNHQV
ncbi:MAG: hypothetical protein E6G13_02600, partial [Actinobacteria bacterium]